ncbi:MAG: type IV pili twitching motility protein PilT [Candidatus Harrisonbacteria bacterium CG10_big_fil_rev_8_21_14_0_10_44_23]|uniref:Type IV pili twitching motility protein PilT n=1 Tax=Candidatus Harrisonbacteria bacterium CG10_big_fil_rev_8_21_14_0_10_44_23 TaxID=1974585 RepID=A0A2H0UR03_9BACT|nr:MAG: type IV pili twitching motility protein PilT [Candidatus Harrisonbacteria bacterium CG10_big_fil_rev_8_21_14_0_10_44_23]
MDYQKKLNELLVATEQQNASDLHISVGKKPTLRVDSKLIALEQEDIITPESAEGLVSALLNDEQKEIFAQKKEYDFSFAHGDGTRFRVNVFLQKTYMAAALRLIPSQIKTIEELNLPPVLHDFAKLSQGFVLVVGPAGHGKSTTLAALLDEINHTRTDHLITVEDPIEYLFTQDRSMISQREVGPDTRSFNSALRSVLRQDPDVIMVGEMRDPESISTAMTAAETGHLVFSTLHTNSASQSIDRIIDSFPEGQQGQVTSQLAATLVGIVSQRLIPRINGGLVPAVEIMIVNSAIKNLIREKKAYQIDLVIETNLQEGMSTLNRSLAMLVKQKEITMENAELYSPNPAEFRILMEKI